MIAARYTQSNLLLPVASFATDAFKNLIAGSDTPRRAMQRATAEACRVGARAYVRAQIPGITGAMTRKEKAEILGMFTAYYLHTVFAAVTGQYRDSVDASIIRHFIQPSDWLTSTGTDKNFFDVMIKTGLDNLLRSGNTAVIDEMAEWWSVKDFVLDPTASTNELLRPLALAIYASTDTTVKGWIDNYWTPNTNGASTYFKKVASKYAQNFDPITGTPVRTSPTGSNPPAYIIGGGANEDGFVAGVVEVREFTSDFSTKATTSDAAGVNTYVSALTGNIEWDGGDTTWPAVV